MKVEMSLQLPKSEIQLKLGQVRFGTSQIQKTITIQETSNLQNKADGPVKRVRVCISTVTATVPTAASYKLKS